MGGSLPLLIWQTMHIPAFHYDLLSPNSIHIRNLKLPMVKNVALKAHMWRYLNKPCNNQGTFSCSFFGQNLTFRKSIVLHLKEEELPSSVYVLSNLALEFLRGTRIPDTALPICLCRYLFSMGKKIIESSPAATV